jgi:hypothetical protein
MTLPMNKEPEMVKLHFTKQFTDGLLRGMDYPACVEFESVDEAAAWAKKHTISPVKPGLFGGSSSYVVRNAAVHVGAR